MKCMWTSLKRKALALFDDFVKLRSAECQARSMEVHHDTQPIFDPLRYGNALIDVVYSGGCFVLDGEKILFDPRRPLRLATTRVGGVGTSSLPT